MLLLRVLPNRVPTDAVCQAAWRPLQNPVDDPVTLPEADMPTSFWRPCPRHGTQCNVPQNTRGDSRWKSLCFPGLSLWRSSPAVSFAGVGMPTTSRCPRRAHTVVQHVQQWCNMCNMCNMCRSYVPDLLFMVLFPRLNFPFASCRPATLVLPRGACQPLAPPQCRSVFPPARAVDDPPAWLGRRR